MTKIDAYKARMLVRKAARAGCTVAEFLARGEADYARLCRVGELRAQPRSGWLGLIWHAAACGRAFSTFTAEPTP